MTDFANTVADWHDFYILAGTAAATLMGLLFVATSLRLDFLSADENAESRARVTNSFEGFLYVLFFSLIFVVPDLDPESLGIPLFIISIIRVINVERRAWRAFVSRGRTFWKWDTIVAYQIPGISYLLVAGYTWPMVQGHADTNGFGWFVGIILSLLGAATASAWHLMLGTDWELPRAKRAKRERNEREMGEPPVAGDVEADHRG